MQQISKLIGFNLRDIKSLPAALLEASTFALQKYQQETKPRVKLIDNFCIFALFVFAVQLSYGVVFSREPFDSFIAGVFCSLGLFAMTIALRIQLTTDAFAGSSKKQCVFEYILGCLTMFFAALLLMR